MTNVFLSYATKDHIFSELAYLKLVAAGLTPWRDRRQLRAGQDWRLEIERGIADSLAVLVVLSINSSQSHFVTYEWAYALGKEKVIVPIKLDDCQIHPKLETIQYLDFTVAGALPWDDLINRIKEIDIEAIKPETILAISQPQTNDDFYVRAILKYLDGRGYQIASFDRLRRRIDESLTDEKIIEIISKNPIIFRSVKMQTGEDGLGKINI